MVLRGKLARMGVTICLKWVKNRYLLMIVDRIVITPIYHKPRVKSMMAY